MRGGVDALAPLLVDGEVALLLQPPPRQWPSASDAEPLRKAGLFELVERALYRRLEGPFIALGGGRVGRLCRRPQLVLYPVVVLARECYVLGECVVEQPTPRQSA